MWRIRSKWRMLKRMLFWAWHMRDAQEYDYTGIYKAIHGQLKRTYEYQVKHGISVTSDPNHPHTRKLLIASELAKRLDNDEYHPPEFDDCFEISNDDKGFRFKVKDERRLSWASEREEYRRQQDMDMFFHIMKKYIRYFWD